MRHWWHVPFLFLALAFSIWLGMIAVALQVRVGPYPVMYQVADAVNIKGGNSYQKFQEFDPQRHHDVVFIGSSHAYRGYDPHLFVREGLSAFNLGSSAQTPLNSLQIVRHCLVPDRVGLLVVDVFRGAFEMDGLESSADLVQNIASDRAAMGMVWNMHDPRGLNMLAVRSMTRNGAPYYIDSAYVGLGFSVQRRTADADMELTRERDRPVLDRQLAFLEDILDWCRENDVPVVLVDHPAPHGTKGEWHTDWSRTITTIAERHGVPFIDMAYTHDLDAREHFYDHTHLNQAGVERFDPLLIGRLRSLGLLAPSGRPG